MALTTSEQVILVNELTNDPLSRGYAAMTESEVVDSLVNNKDRSHIRERMDSSEVFQAIDIAEYLSKTDQQQRNIMAVLAFGSVNPQGKEAALFQQIFGGGSATISALQTARTEYISRAQELGISNVYVVDVEKARGL